jgi:hypothetical protein
MCCIIHRPTGAKEIPDSTIEEIIRINPHGWGVSYMKNNKLQIEKSMEMSAVKDKIRGLEKEDLEFIFHARWATHGDKNLVNCHPFKIKNGALFHNGRINVYCRDKGFSDTFFFSQKVSKYLRKNKSYDWIVNKFKSEIGQSRLAFMTFQGEITKYGTWHEEEEVFYSKLNWKSSSRYSGGCCDDYELYPYGYPGMLNSGNSPGYMTGQSAFEEALDLCKKGTIIYTGLIKKLSERELILIASKFPKAAAEVMARNHNYDYYKTKRL